MAAGTSSIRTRVTSTRMAVAMPTPMIFTSTDGSRANPAATAIMIAAAEVMIRVVEDRPATMPARPVTPASRCSRMAESMKTS